MHRGEAFDLPSTAANNSAPFPIPAGRRTMWHQYRFQLQPRRRGFHLVTDEILGHCPAIREMRVGLMHVFIQHTSAALTLNENADPTVRADFAAWFDRAVREDEPYYRHTLEGSDDLPAHIKSSLLGSSLSLPVSDGRLNIGTWQGIYLCEHRNHGGARTLVVTLHGE